MNVKKVTKKWLKEYFGIEIEPNKYSSFWQTDGGTGTYDFDKPSSENPKEIFEIVHQSGSKTYWGKLRTDFVDVSALKNVDSTDANGEP